MNSSNVTITYSGGCVLVDIGSRKLRLPQMFFAQSESMLGALIAKSFGLELEFAKWLVGCVQHDLERRRMESR